MLKMQNNPWKGLSQYNEGDELYGRDDDIRDLSQCVLRDKYTLLYGKSGIGKSSILNAAIMPALRRNEFVPIVIRLSHKGSNYLTQINEAIVAVLGEEGVRETRSFFKEKPSLYTYMHGHTFWGADNSRIKLFLIFDQFEEIFALQESELSIKDFFRQLAELCNDIKPERQIEVSTNPKEPVDLELENVEFDLPVFENDYSVEDNEVRMIFTIREDFLSEFDYYTAAIPSLRNNRYYLRPINEEQAAQIIMKPSPGLVDEEVAWLIISKITGRIDFRIDGKPELSVDAAVLSLYLSKLFEARKGYDEPITSDLIEERGGEIIYDFYKDAISTISSTSVEYLEKNLLTGQGRRDNITVFDAMSDGHVTAEELRVLVDEKKLIRKFNYAGELRIEFVHDILCQVVLQHIKEHQLLVLEEERQKKLTKLKKRNVFIIVLTSVLLLTSLALIIILIFANRLQKIPPHKKIEIMFQEEDDYTYWDSAELLVAGITESGDDTVLACWEQVNKAFKDSVLYVLADSMECVKVKLSFIPSGSFKDVDTILYFNEKSTPSFISFRLPIRQKKPCIYDGEVRTIVNGLVDCPLTNAMIIMGDRVSRTGSDGRFHAQFEDSIKDDEILYILKKGFKPIERRAGELIKGGTFETIFMTIDSVHLSNFEKQCVEMDYLLQAERGNDSIHGFWNWEYWYNKYKNRNGFKIITSESEDDELVIVARSLPHQERRDSRPVSGLCYYVKEYDKYRKMGFPHYSYRIFVGTLDKKNGQNPKSERYFRFESLNFVNEYQCIQGTFLNTVYNTNRLEIFNIKGELIGELKKQ